MAVAALLINNQLMYSYDDYLNMSYVKGAIQLPPFNFLFLLTDFVSSIALILLIAVRTGTTFFRLSYARISFDILRLVFIYVVFTTITGHYWLKESIKQFNWNYQRFKSQVKIDFATYYLRHGKTPENLQDFTRYSINPVNNSSLIYSKGSLLSTTVTDEKGNKILESYKDFIGINTYKDNPSEFFSIYRIENKTLCLGSLIIPSEYNQYPPGN